MVLKVGVVVDDDGDVVAIKKVKVSFPVKGWRDG